MRKILPLVAILALTLTVAPRAAGADGPTLELKSGTMFAGGTVGYSRDDESMEQGDYLNDHLSSELVFSPTVGYFITPTLALTGSVNVGLKTVERKYTDTSDSSSTKELQQDKPMGVALGLRFLIPTGGRMCLYVGGEVAYTRTDTEYEATDGSGATYKGEWESYLMGVNLFGGLLYSLTNHVALDVGIKFSYQKGELEMAREEDNVEMENNGFSLGYLGLMAFF